jgi:hypothetical protein
MSPPPSKSLIWSHEPTISPQEIAAVDNFHQLPGATNNRPEADILQYRNRFFELQWSLGGVVECWREAVNQFTDCAPQDEIIAGFAEKEAAARLQHSKYLRKQRASIIDVVHATENEDCIEDAVRERKRRRVALHKDNMRVRRVILYPGLKHVLGDVDTDAAAYSVADQLQRRAASAANLANEFE